MTRPPKKTTDKTVIKPQPIAAKGRKIATMISCPSSQLIQAMNAPCPLLQFSGLILSLSLSHMDRLFFIVESQVSNWFINARVRLWKPMVEEMYQHERKDEEEEEEEGEVVVVGEERERQQLLLLQAESKDNHSQTAARAPRPTPSAATAGAGKRSEINARDKDASAHAINRQCFSENQVNNGKDDSNINSDVGQMGMPHLGGPDESRGVMDDMCISRMGMGSSAAAMAAAAASVGSGPPLASAHHSRFGTTGTGDVSLTLGLRHAGNMPAEKSRFSIGDFGDC